MEQAVSSVKLSVRIRFLIEDMWVKPYAVKEKAGMLHTSLWVE